ncbi:NUDIX hydrolase [candidate division KSB1 bacterium]|nr:NUDIX hydrolase [candidate division KSB1 bacterium]
MEYCFCPLCGSELILPSKSGSKKPRPACVRCEFIHYGNPKPCVGAVIIKNGKVLLIQRANEPYKYYWDFPGGFLECGELPEEGLRREMMEELSIDISVIRLLGIYPDSYGPKGDATLNIYYLCKVSHGEITPQTEIAEAKWFALDELPRKLAFGHVELVLKTWKKWRDKKSPVLV